MHVAPVYRNGYIRTYANFLRIPEDQIQKMLDDYVAAGGSYDKVAIPDSGHVPFITHPDEFNRVFHAHLEKTS